MLESVKLYGTTDALGDLTVTDTMAVHGKLYAIQWIDGTFANGVDAVFTITDEASGVDQTLLTLTNADDDAWYYPRTTADDLAGSAIATEFVRLILNGKLEMVVSAGGNVLEGGAIVFYDRYTGRN